AAWVTRVEIGKGGSVKERIMNSIRFLTPAIHGLGDYAAAVALIVLPFLLGFSGVALWLSVAGGVGLTLYSLITDYRFGVASVISFRVHEVLDLSAAAAFIAAPFVFGWTGLVMGYYLVMAAGVIVVVALTNPDPDVTDTVEPRLPVGS
ncbi:MAG: hypothetical protein ACR2PZ_23825, partial [Pseudomonadales bacterium]